VTREWRKMGGEELRNFYCSANAAAIVTKGDMNKTQHVWEYEKCIQNFDWKA
jgi:hypothetical protein